MCENEQPKWKGVLRPKALPDLRNLLFGGLKIGMIAIAGVASADGTARHYHIPAKSLDNGLLQLAADSGLEVLFTADKVRGITGNNLDGNLTPSQALAQLLQGSGMTFRFVDAGTVTIEPASNFRKTATTPENPEPQSSSSEGQLMPKVTVEADAEYDPEYYADPYNKDYVLPHSSFGTKTDTPVMETPLNVQTVSKQIMKDQQAVSLKDTFRNVSGVSAKGNTGNLNYAGNNVNITLRGFKAEDIARNGVRQNANAGSGRQLANVESVDVLKGPAAILMGLVEPGGMVNVNTKQPLTMPYYGFTQQFGSYDFYRTTLDATGPLNKAKDLLYRVNLSYENSGSFRDFVGNDDVFLAPVFKWVISPKTQVTFEMEYEHQNQNRDIGYLAPSDSNGNLLNVPINFNYFPKNPGNTERIFGSFNWSHQFNDDWTIKHRFSVDSNQNNVPYYGLPAYIINDKILTAIARTEGESTTYNTTLDLTGHFDTFGLKHTLLTGGDYYRSESAFAQDVFAERFALDQPLDIFNPFPAYFYQNYNPFTGSYTARSLRMEDLTGGPLPPITSVTPLEDLGHVDQYGLYIQDQIKLPYDVHVTGGIRYQYIHQNNIDSGQMNDAVTPRVGILWQPQKWLSLYATYTESFGANGARVFIAKDKFRYAKPTSAESYEGGIKTEFFGGKLRATLSYFDLTKTNVAAPDTELSHTCNGGLPLSCSLEIGAVRSRGPELDIQGEILPGWNIVANWSNTDIRVAETNAAGDPIDLGDGAQLKVGDRVYDNPRNIAHLWSTYEIQSGDIQGLSFGGGLNFVNGNTDDLNKVMPGYVTADLLASYTRKLKDVTLSLQFNVNNLLDKRYSTFTANGVGPSSLWWYAIGEPRTFMGQVSVQY